MPEEATKSRIGRRFVLSVLVIIGMYVLGYGFCRWQNILVHKEDYTGGFKVGPIVSSIGPRCAVPREGRLNPIRDFLTEPAFFIYRPFASLETRLRH